MGSVGWVCGCVNSIFESGLSLTLRNRLFGCFLPAGHVKHVLRLIDIFCVCLCVPTYHMHNNYVPYIVAMRLLVNLTAVTVTKYPFSMVL